MITTTNGVRSTAVIEQPNPNNELQPPRNNEPGRSSKDASNSRTENLNENQYDRSKYKVPEFREPYPGASTHRGFPFDPRVTDQIISNANISRPVIKEEFRSASPHQREVPRHDVPRHDGPRTSHRPEQQGIRAVKQEAYSYHAPPHPSRPTMMGPLPQQQSSKGQMHQTSQSSR